MEITSNSPSKELKSSEKELENMVVEKFDNTYELKSLTSTELITTEKSTEYVETSENLLQKKESGTNTKSTDNPETKTKSPEEKKHPIKPRSQKKRNTQGYSSLNKKKLGLGNSEKSSDRDSSAEKFSKMSLGIDDINNLYSFGGGERSDQELSYEEEYQFLEKKIKLIAKHCVEYMKGNVTDCNSYKYSLNNIKNFALSDTETEFKETKEMSMSVSRSVKGPGKAIAFNQLSLTNLQGNINNSHYLYIHL